MLDLQLLHQYDSAIPDRVVSLNASADLARIQLGNSYGDIRSIVVGKPGYNEVHVSSHPLSNIIDDTIVRDANGIMFSLIAKNQHKDLIADRMFSGKTISCAASDGADRIAIVTKKHIRVMKRSGLKSWTRTHEMELPSRMSPILMVFDDDLICLGTPSQYCIYRLRTSGTMTAVSLDHVPVSGIIPACEIMSQSQQVVLSTSTRLGIFVSYDGMPVPDRYPLEWSSAPLALRLCGVCIVALLPAGRLEVFTIAQSHLVQTLNLGADCVISSRSFPDVGFAAVDQQHLYLAKPMSFEDQIAYHVRALNVQAAEAVLRSMSPSQEMLDSLNIRLAQNLIRHLLFQEAFNRLERVSYPVHPDVLLQMIPVIGDDLSHPDPTAFQKIIDCGRSAITEDLEQLIVHERDKTQLLKRAEEMSDVIIVEAHRLLASYLWERRTQYDTTDSRTTIDTVLVYLAVSLPSDQVSFTFDQLLLPTNSCQSEFCEQFLRIRSADVYALFLQSQQRFSEALSIWSQSQTEFALRSSIALLSSLNGDNDLIYEHAAWIFHQDRKQGPVIFCRCHPGRVIGYLQQPAASALDLIAYLEYLVEEEGCLDAVVHTLLAQMYLRDDEYCEGKLLEFLRNSTAYDASELLREIQGSKKPFCQEQIIVLSRLGAHDQVQRLYLNELGDIDGAIRYTESLLDPDAVIGLAKQLFNPSTELHMDQSKLQEIAVNILCRHGRDVDPVAALSLLPANIPLAAIVSLLSRVINCSNSKKRLTQIELSLHSIELFRSEKALREHQKCCILVKPSSLCRVCHQPIAGKPFSMYGSRLFHNQCR